MSQAVAEVQVRELKMNDPKLNKIFDKQTVFKGKTGIFEIENKNIKHLLNFYKVENNRFKEIF